jgi:serine/threonine-protein kinase RsbW/stage II sporulation protein AB (anti-sigma F factor)
MDLDLEARPEELARLRRVARSWMEAVGTPAVAAGDVLVALSEAATNAVLHAYPPDAPGQVRIRGRRLHDELEVVVEDDGRWRDRPADHDGRGLGIIRALSTALDVTRGAHGSRVAFRCPLTTAVPPS